MKKYGIGEKRNALCEKNVDRGEDKMRRVGTVLPCIIHKRYLFIK